MENLSDDDVMISLRIKMKLMD